MATFIERDWKAVHRGRIYCAPVCGANCTWAAFQDATAKAKALAKLLGKGWKPDVHENMGWYWGAKKGVMSVSASNHRGGNRSLPGTYTCYCNTSPQFLGKGTTPRKAVTEAINALDEYVVSLLEQRKAL